MKLTRGEIYFIGERDPETGNATPYYKIGIVRDKDGRGTVKRLREHQTGNPRPLFIHKIIQTEVVERVETLMHGVYAQLRRGDREWFKFTESKLQSAVEQADAFAAEAAQYAPLFRSCEILKESVSTDVVVPASEELKRVHLKVLISEELIKQYRSVTTAIRKSMSEAIEKGEDIGDAAKKANVSEKETFNAKRFEEENPDIYAKYLSYSETSSRRWSLTRPKGIVELEEYLAENVLPIISDIEAAIDNAKTGVIPKDELNNYNLIALEKLAVAEWEYELGIAELKVAIGSNAGIEGLCSWKTTRTKRRIFDTDKFREENFELYKSYLELKSFGGQILVNPGRKSVG